MDTHNILNYFIFSILSLNFEQVITEVKEVKTPLLSQQYYDCTASPVQPVSKALPKSKE